MRPSCTKTSNDAKIPKSENFLELEWLSSFDFFGLTGQLFSFSCFFSSVELIHQLQLQLTFFINLCWNVKTWILFYLELKIFSRNFVFLASLNRDARLVGIRTSNLKINSAGIQVRTFLFAWLILITELVVTGFEPKTSGVEAAKFTTYQPPSQ